MISCMPDWYNENQNMMNESTDQSSHNLCDRWTGFMAAASLVVLQILLERPSRNFYSRNRSISFVVHCARPREWVGGNAVVGNHRLNSYDRVPRTFSNPQVFDSGFALLNGCLVLNYFND